MRPSTRTRTRPEGLCGSDRCKTLVFLAMWRTPFQFEVVTTTIEGDISPH